MRLTQAAAEELETPCLLLDLPRFRQNCATLRARAKALGVTLRPHMKTAKSAEAARLAAGGHGPITVSTLTEAEYFAAAGFTDILYAVAAVPQRLERVARLIAEGVRLTLILDCLAAVEALAARAEELGIRLDLLIEIDSGEHRSGVSPEGDALLAIGRAIAESGGLALRGVMTHAGHSYAARGPEALAEVAEAERAAAVGAAERLRKAGLPAPVVSVGSTPTAMHARQLAGVTELRAGVYMFGDLFQAEIGACRFEDIAVGVLASVIGLKPERNELLLDAGGLALSKDRSTASAPHDWGYGQVVGLDGRPLGPLTVARVYQEHGVVTGQAPLPFARLPLGAKVLVLPNHVCMTAAMYPRYHLVEAEGVLAGTWERINGWEPPPLAAAAAAPALL